MFGIIRLFILLLGMLISQDTIKAWGTSELNIGGEKKQRTNFFGCLKTYQGLAMAVDNISIDMRQRADIRVYVKPNIENTIKDFDQDDSLGDFNEIRMAIDPMASFIEIRLDRIRQIRVLDNQTIWTYVRKGHRQTQKFIEIIIVLKGSSNSERSYLIETKSKIYCDGIDDAGNEVTQARIAFSDLVELNLKGSCVRDDAGKCPSMPRAADLACEPTKQTSANPAQEPKEQRTSKRKRRKQAQQKAQQEAQQALQQQKAS